jgi:hypothetical protein
MVLCFILACKVNAYPMEDGSIPPEADEDNSKMIDDDEPMSWYKPIAVILKPATEKDLRERLTQSSTRTTISYPQPQTHPQPVISTMSRTVNNIRRVSKSR